MTPPQAFAIRTDQINCMGCLSACQFSNWAQTETGTTGKKADPRSFCIQKTLQKICHSDDIETELMFAGHNAYKFASRTRSTPTAISRPSRSWSTGW